MEIKQKEFLTIKEAKKYFSKLDFDDVDIVFWFCSANTFGKFYDNYTYITEGKTVIPLRDKDNILPYIEWVDEKKVVYVKEPKNRIKETIDIKRLRFKFHNPKCDLNILAENAIGCQCDEERWLIKFVKKLCPLLTKMLDGGVIEEKIRFEDNKISLKLVAALLTTWIFFDKRLALCNEEEKLRKNKLNQLEVEERRELNSISARLEKLESDINIGTFIKWLMNNHEIFSSLDQNIEKNYKKWWSNHRPEINSIKNSFIALSLIRLVYETLESASRLNSLSPDSIIDTDNTESYLDKITKFAKNFIPTRPLSKIKCDGASNKENFKQIIDNNLRWFVSIDDVDIFSTAGNACYPKITHEEDKEIRDKLKLAPFYKLAKKLPNNKETNYEIMLINTGKITINKNQELLLELPEELDFLNTHYGYFIRLPLNRKNGVTKSEITSDDIVMPESEALKLEKCLQKKSDSYTLFKQKENDFQNPLSYNPPPPLEQIKHTSLDKNIFRKIKTGWEVVFCGEDKSNIINSLGNKAGLPYIRFLLAHIGQSFNKPELYGLVNNSSDLPQKEKCTENVPIIKNLNPNTSKAEAKKQLEIVDTELAKESTTLEQKEKLKEIKKEYKKIINAPTSRKGDTVRNAINRTLKELKSKEENKKLSEHFEKHLITKHVCLYENNNIEWVTIPHIDNK